MEDECLKNFKSVRASNERAVLRAARKYGTLMLLGVITENDQSTQPDPKQITDLLDLFTKTLLQESENMVRMDAILAGRIEF